MVQVTAAILLDNKTGIYAGMHCWTEKLPLMLSEYKVHQFYKANLCICEGCIAHPTTSLSLVGNNSNSSLPFSILSFPPPKWPILCRVGR